MNVDAQAALEAAQSDDIKPRLRSRGRRGAAARRFRRAELRHRRRRIVLGQRPAGAGARAWAKRERQLIAELVARGSYGSSRIGRPALRHVLSWPARTVYSPKWKIEAASTAVAWPSRMPATR